MSDFNFNFVVKCDILVMLFFYDFVKLNLHIKSHLCTGRLKLNLMYNICVCVVKYCVSAPIFNTMIVVV